MGYPIQAPVRAFVADPSDPSKRKEVIITKDDGIRAGTTKESLGKIRAAFPQWGPATTGGNASQITDGGAAVLLMKRSTAERLGLKSVYNEYHCGVHDVLMAGIQDPRQARRYLSGRACSANYGHWPGVCHSQGA